MYLLLFQALGNSSLDPNKQSPFFSAYNHVIGRFDFGLRPIQILCYAYAQILAMTNILHNLVPYYAFKMMLV